MQDHNGAEKDFAGLERVDSLVKSSSLFYIAMAGIGLLIAHFRHHNLTQLFSIPHDLRQGAILLSLGVMGSLVLLIANYLFEEQFPSYKAFRHVLMRMVGGASILSAVYLAILSAAGEEILFRGAIQPVIGVVGTALLFGLLHLGPRGLVSAWTLWAILSGLMLGWMCEETGSIWPSILCHFLVNTSSMLRLRSQYKQFLRDAAKIQESKAKSELISGL